MSITQTPGHAPIQGPEQGPVQGPVQRTGLAARLRGGGAAGGLLSGGMVLLISTTVVNLGNYLFNLIMGRWLGPAAFADVSLLVTLFLVVTLVTSTLQTVAARYGAIYQAGGRVESLGGLRTWAVRWAWLLGLGCAAVMVIGAPFWQQFFHTQSPWPFVILGVGTPIYFAQGVDRGILQGSMRFGVLALSYQAEMWARLFFGVVLVAAGLAVNGAVAALTLSFIATWLVARTVRRSLPAAARLGADQVQDALHFAGPVAVALLGHMPPWP
jgi:O-antigen/teichoic acid export membrane protein